MDRRHFVASLGATLATSTLLPQRALATQSASSADFPVELDLTAPANSALSTVGGALYVTVTGLTQPIIVVRTGTSSFSAFSSECTHLGCRVGLPSAGVAVCPCHNSRFDLTGAVVQGPALTALTGYFTALSDTTLTISDSAAVGSRSSSRQSTRLFMTQRGGSLNVMLSGPPVSGYYEIVDLSGKVRASGNLQRSSGFVLNPEHLGSGTFVLRIDTDLIRSAQSFRLA